MTNSRIRRGRKTQDLVAAALSGMFPHAKGAPASLGGKDILNTPGLAIECKATANVTLPAWLRQARRNASENELPVAVYRPVGAGDKSIEDWGVVISFGDFVHILEALGFGDRP